ncbi:MAG: hypothetical protein IJE84_05220 [Clostridia bacterium]|nr:hypothetical protein [Clostridia bacterium]
MSAKRLKHYKQSRYRKHRAPVNKKLVLVIISGVIMLAGSIALGNYLSYLSSLPPADTAETEDTSATLSPYDKYPHIETEKGQTLPLSSSAYLSEEAAERAVMKAAGELVRSLSFNLTDGRGIPNYKSGVYEKAYSAPSSVLELDKLISTAAKSGVRLSGVLSYRSANEEYSDIREIRESFELAVISECYALGLRQLTLTDVETRDPDALYAILCKIKERAPDLAVGILLRSGDGEGNALFWQRIADAFDFIALDYTQELERDLAPDEQTKTETGEGEGQETNIAPAEPEYELAKRILADFYLIERHGAIPTVTLRDESALTLTKEILSSTGIKNTTIILQTTTETD